VGFQKEDKANFPDFRFFLIRLQVKSVLNGMDVIENKERHLKLFLFKWKTMVHLVLLHVKQFKDFFKKEPYVAIRVYEMAY